MQGQMVKSYKFPFRKRCDLCHKSFNDLYVTQFDGITYHFCSQPHLISAKKNFDEKKDKVKPGVQAPPESGLTDIMEDSIEDNI